MITAFITINLTADYDHDAPNRDRQQLSQLDSLPDNARVVIDLGARVWFTEDPVQWTRAHAHRLRIEVTGKHFDVVDRYVRAVAAGSLAEVVA